ncbi:hypothetical protein [Bradyrhizobium sp.]|uniref:hypothetical protein n=1 Tax=Bradyrhizobium sp. TaxID=376 RepID=UPI001DC53DC1|nr:hypothetical protein [Bradyrhizobium sp.]MBI5319911.1 hypothetical protein [Bradyrhizobium sp.]
MEATRTFVNVSYFLALVPVAIGVMCSNRRWALLIGMIAGTLNPIIIRYDLMSLNAAEVSNAIVWLPAIKRHFLGAVIGLIGALVGHFVVRSLVVKRKSGDDRAD